MPRKQLDQFTELNDFELDVRSIQMLPLAFCSRHNVVVLGKVDIASPEPIHLGVLEQNTATRQLTQGLSMRWARPVLPVQLTSFEIQRALDVAYGVNTVGDLMEGHPLPTDLNEANHESPPSHLVDCTMLHAIQKRASDIHIECYSNDVDVRVRIDGVLYQLQTHISPDNINGVVNRLKIMAGLDIAEQRVPQDGRIRASVIDRQRTSRVDFRINTLPGPYGEDVVLRVLDVAMGLLPIDQLGMTEEMGRDFQQLLDNPEGAVLVTGPTGCGKTTTLYSCLEILKDGSRKILTAEDPIEYSLPKINQKQVSPVMSMADLSRAFLRQDPDIILIGEIRDHDTAITAAKAASTGHLVLGTLHTSDALGAIPRLRSLNLDDDQISDSLLAVLAQRLARRICTSCIEPTELTPEQRKRLGPLATNLRPSVGKGCSQCNDTGYRGRVGFFELMVIDHELQGEIAAGKHAPGLREILARKEHKSLIDDAVLKINHGQTSVDELLRVIPYRQLQAEIRSRTT